jgi:hypothetical protein
MISQYNSKCIITDSIDPILTEFGLKMGNTKVNKLFEALQPTGKVQKPQPTSERKDKEAFVRHKYIFR